MEILAAMKSNGWAAALIGYQLNALKGSFEEEELLCFYLKQVYAEVSAE